MNEDKYFLKVDADFFSFEFESHGKNGSVTKIVRFTKSESEEYYNLGFGDKNEQTGEINDSITTNNGDMKKILATLILIIYFFTQKYPESWVYIEGSNSVRTKLYKIVISNNLFNLQKDFFVLGLYKGEWREFAAGIDFTAFLIQRKKD